METNLAETTTGLANPDWLALAAGPLGPIPILGVDARHNTRGKLSPPAPLPVLSRRALSRVTHRIAPPSLCHCCLGPVKLVSNDEIYAGKKHGNWPFAYLCQSCGAYVGLHPHTDLPLGIMATRPTIDARRSAKEAFQAIVRRHHSGDRAAAYASLAIKLGIPEPACHFAMMNIHQAHTAKAACLELLRCK
ncbi:zinc-finger-containing protein [Achromobacter sp. 2789STDY5608633]|uniref:zinc-finger-containing protein n=1 Tax=Achromobacter sp. 2789STDY5608633 TaxID=1806501 RepID=UPI0009E8111D